MAPVREAPNKGISVQMFNVVQIQVQNWHLFACLKGGVKTCQQYDLGHFVDCEKWRFGENLKIQ